MKNEELREFLMSRRARVNPDDAGLPAYGSNRRVKGLRREEVAILAGISVEYYTRLERGNAAGVSDSVVEGLNRALQLDEAERAHLADFVRVANSHTTPRRRRVSHTVRPLVQQLLDSMTDAPAFVLNERLDVLAANGLGRALYAPMFGADPRTPVNQARFMFLDPASRAFWVDWEKCAKDTAALLRTAAGRDPYNRQLSDLVGELSTRSEEFRVRWAAHDVKLHHTGVKNVHHPLVGDLTLAFESLQVSADAGQVLLVYSAEPGSASREALNLLAGWTATAHVELSAVPADRTGS
ncbi:helix-turn-helix transcriptional regulator [Pengzhenrongella sp.]|uniref:helix-turn-helix transcriptional regulator n=1 Tax=Pengzhenrongella sp. TaxID=2888820 RepID=UPI002F94830C